MKNRSICLLLIFLFCLAVTLFSFVSNKVFASYKEFIPLTWNGGNGCNLNRTVKTTEAICVSSPFLPSTNYLELSLRSDDQVTVKVTTADNFTEEIFEIPPTIKTKKDRGYFFDTRIILSHVPTAPIKFNIIAKENQKIKFEAKNRVDLYEAVSANTVKLANSTWVRALTVVFFGAILIIIGLKLNIVKIEKTSTLFLLLTIVAFIVHYRFHLFYNWDEWVILNLFLDNGFSEAFKRYNEHFMPVYFPLYYLAIQFFLSFYDGLVFFSLLILSLNSLLVIKIISKLCPWPEISAPVSKIIGFLYLVNSLHHEGAQWALAQCTFLSHTFSLVAVLCAIRYLAEMKKQWAVLAAVMIPLSSFSYGNGFITGVLVALIAIYFVFYLQRQNPKILIYLFGSIFVSSALIAAIYFFNSEGTGHITVSFDKKDLANLDIVRRFFIYLFIETQFGGILRGLGLMPSLSSDIASELLKNHSTLRFFPEITLAVIGAIISFGFLCFYFSFKQYRGQYLALWLVGQTWLVIALILPALARWNFAYQQALAPRYQHAALIGLFIIIIPIFHICYQRWQSPAVRVLAFIAMLFYISVNLFMASSFDYFTKLGETNLAFVEKMATIRDVDACLEKPKPVNCPDYPQNFDGGLRMKEIIRMLKYLKLIPSPTATTNEETNLQSLVYSNPLLST